MSTHTRSVKCCVLIILTSIAMLLCACDQILSITFINMQCEALSVVNYVCAQISFIYLFIQPDIWRVLFPVVSAEQMQSYPKTLGPCAIIGS